MVYKKDAFSALSMKDRAELLNIYVKGGMMDLKEIKAHYNSLYEEKEPNKYGWGGASKEALGKAFGDASSAVSSVTGIAGSAMTMVSNGMENAEINTTEADNAIEAVESYKLDNSSLDALANSYNATPWAATDYDSSDFTKSGWEIAGNTFESTLSGITTGASVGGPWGAVIGGLAGLGSGLIGWGIGESKAEEAERRLEAEAKKANRAIELSAVNTRDSILQKQANNTLRNIAADGGRLLKGDEEEQTLSGKPWYQKLLESGQSARDARVGAVGAQQVRDLYNEGKTEEASELAKKYAKANTTGIALAGGAASTGLLGDLIVTGATTTADTLLEGNLNNLGWDLLINGSMDALGHGAGKVINYGIQNVSDWLKYQTKYRKHLGKLMDFTDSKLPVKEGSESTVYIDKDVVHKVMDQGVAEMTPEELIKFNDRLVSNRNLPPHVIPIEVEGVVKGQTRGKYYPVYKQEKVKVVGDETMPSYEWEKHKELLDKKMIDAGWTTDGGSYYYNKELNKYVSDISPMNTGYKDGEIVIIDGEVYKQGGKLNNFGNGGRMLGGDEKEQTLSGKPLLNTPYNNSFLYQPETETVEEPVVENTYTVKQGDSLSKIANSFNIPLELLKKENPMKDYNRISIGQTLQIPKYEQPKQPVITEDFDVYNVKSGDTLSKIAKDNNTSVSKLLQINPQIKNQNIINIGDSINIRKNVKPDEVQKTWVDVEDLREQEKEFNKSNLGAIQGYKHDSNYVVVDKKGKKLTVYNANNEKVYETSDISTGLSGDDYNTVTYTKKVNGKDVIDHGKGNMSTPAGITKISSITDYHGAPAFQRARLNDEGNIRRVKDSETGELIDDNVASSFHSGKTSAIYSSNGCVRMSNKALKELSQYIDVGTTCYTLPDKEGSRFVLKDGNLNFEVDNPFGLTEKNVKFNAYGKDMESHDDYNVHIDRRSTPIKIEYNGWDGLLGVRGDNIEKLIDGIVSNKEDLQKAFKVSDQHYNKIAHIALGLIGQESKYGTHRDYIAKKALSSYDMGNMLNDHKIKDHKKETGVSALDAVKVIKKNNTYNSLGMGQIKIEGDNEETQRYYKMFGVTPENVYSDEKTAEAIMIRLLSMYNNEVRGRKFKNKETDHVIDSYDALLYLYKGGELAKKLRNGEAIGKNTYIDNIKDYMKNFKIYTYK